MKNAKKTTAKKVSTKNTIPGYRDGIKMFDQYGKLHHEMLDVLKDLKNHDVSTHLQQTIIDTLLYMPGTNDFKEQGARVGFRLLEFVNWLEGLGNLSGISETEIWNIYNTVKWAFILSHDYRTKQLVWNDSYTQSVVKALFASTTIYKIDNMGTKNMPLLENLEVLQAYSYLHDFIMISGKLIRAEYPETNEVGITKEQNSKAADILNRLDNLHR